MFWFYFTIVTLGSSSFVSSQVFKFKTAKIGESVEFLVPAECQKKRFSVQIWTPENEPLCRLSKYELLAQMNRAEASKTKYGLVCELKEFEASDQGTYLTTETFSNNKFSTSNCSMKFQLIADCGPPPSIGNNTNIPSWNKTTRGSKATYECLPGFEVTDKDDLTIMCQHSGLWDPVPTCTPKNCGDPVNGPNTDSPRVTGTTYKNTAKYTCLPGFEIANKDDLTIMCQQNGKWGSAPKCTPKNCGDPVIGINTDSPRVTSTIYKNTAKYTCLPGFEIADKDDLTIMCQQNGKWGPAPKCTPKKSPEKVPEVPIRLTTCPVSIDDRGMQWNSSDANNTVSMPCADGYIGQIKRRCDSHGVYLPAVYNCTSATTINLKTKLSSEEGWNSTTILENLFVIVADDNETMYEGDISVIGKILGDVTENFTGDPEETETFFNIVDNLIAEENSPSWRSLKETGENGAEALLQSIDKANEKIMAAVMTGKMEENITVTGENLYSSVGLIDKENSSMIVFPRKSDRSSTNWPSANMATIYVPIIQGPERLAYAGVLYRNASDLLSTDTSGTSRKKNREKEKPVFNSVVISMSLPEMFSGSLKEPVTIQFKTINKIAGKSECSFLNLTTKRWETNGCWEDLSSAATASDVITCKCNHLTNFALLMSTVGVKHVAPAHSRALSMLTLSGITLSCVCLIVNIILYALFWRFIVSEANIIIINVCVVLLAANAVFIFGVTETSDEIVCKIIAVVLHFLYLAFFLLMLAVGINLTMNAISTKKHKWGKRLCGIAYVLAGVIVGISAGYFRLEGYGNENFCWLGNDKGQIWTFIGPVIAVILTNVCFVVIVMRKYLGLSINQKKESSGKIKAAAKALGAMMSVTGVTWVFGVLSVNQATLVFQYLFVACNSLQGVFILIFYGITNVKIKNKLGERFADVSGATELTSVAKQSSQSCDRYTSSDV